jgi:hypothetical protein
MVVSADKPSSNIGASTLVNDTSEEWIAALTDAMESSPYSNLNGEFNLSACSDFSRCLDPAQNIVRDLRVSSNGINTNLERSSNGSKGSQAWLWNNISISHFPRLMLVGFKGAGHGDLASAVLHHCEALPVVNLDFPTLLNDVHSHSIEQV